MARTSVPAELKFTKEHEWAAIGADGVVTIGITDYAQDALGDVTFVELPAVGREFKAGDTFGVVESVKTFSDLYAPVSGAVVEVNAAVVDDPSTLNTAPYGAAWLIKVRPSSPDELAALLDAAGYTSLIESSG
jgi:glycine cleavage system H protein